MNLKYLTVGISCLAAGLIINNFALSSIPMNFKLGVVDVQKVVSSSSEVKALKEAHDKDIKELEAFVKKANTEIANEKDKVKKKALETKYVKQLNDKKTAVNDEYNKKLAKVNRDITKIIRQTAQEKEINVVLTKGVVLYGGVDLTPHIEKAVSGK